jgi:hypothetical protein
MHMAFADNDLGVRQVKKPGRGGATVDEYISKQSLEQQVILTRLRNLVKKAAPHLEEAMKWSMPWYVNGKENVCAIMAAGSWVDLGFLPRN